MEKFSDYKYERIDFDKTVKTAKQIIKAIEDAKDFDEQCAQILRYNGLISEVQSMATIANIRNSVDTADEFYEKERNYYDDHLPVFEEYSMQYYKALLGSKFRSQIAEKWGEYILVKAQAAVDSFSPELIEDLQKDNRLTAEYQKLMARSLIEFQGEKHNLSELKKFLQNPDRSVRKAAYEALAQFLGDHQKELDDLYGKLVQVRTKMAEKLGHTNFIRLGYLKMQRTDYTEKQVEIFRKQVLDYLVPICTKIRQKQAERIGVDTLKFYDRDYMFTDGNAMPAGDADHLIQCAADMYAAISPQTKEFFGFMMDEGLMDLLSKHNKAMGGYCTYIPSHKAPFIFSNFNGTSADVDVLTHEAGHAFQAYRSRDIEIFDYMSPTYEACEIHSMSMEYFAYPYMDAFFKDAADKYRFSHLIEGILFIPYGVLVDHFQHEVYANPSMSADERKETWRRLERMYLPDVDYDGNEAMEKGVYWYRQLHIFMYPFYYIDYTFASMNAFDFYGKMKKDKAQAFKEYLHLCDLGGSMSYLHLLKEAGLTNPFEENSVKKVIEPLLEEAGIV